MVEEELDQSRCGSCGTASKLVMALLANWCPNSIISGKTDPGCNVGCGGASYARPLKHSQMAATIALVTGAAAARGIRVNAVRPGVSLPRPTTPSASRTYKALWIL